MRTILYILIFQSLSYSAERGTGKQTVSFGKGDDSAFGIGVKPNGGLVLGGTVYNGTFNDFGIAGLLKNGDLDPSIGKVITGFEAESTISDLKLDGDGKIIVDTSFETDGSYQLYLERAQSVASRDRILVAGSYWNAMSVTRLQTDGVLDTSFNTWGGLIMNIGTGPGMARKVVYDNEGQAFVGGYAFLGGSYQNVIFKLDNKGTLEKSFHTDGILTWNGNIDGGCEPRKVQHQPT